VRFNLLSTTIQKEKPKKAPAKKRQFDKKPAAIKAPAKPKKPKTPK